MQCKYQTVGFLKETELLSKFLTAYNSNSFIITNQKDGNYLLIEFCGKILQKCYPWMWKVTIFFRLYRKPIGNSSTGNTSFLTYDLDWRKLCKSTHWMFKALLPVLLSIRKKTPTKSHRFSDTKWIYSK